MFISGDDLTCIKKLETCATESKPHHMRRKVTITSLERNNRTWRIIVLRRMKSLSYKKKSLSCKSPSSRYIHINIDLHKIYHIDLTFPSCVDAVASTSTLMSVLVTHWHGQRRQRTRLTRRRPPNKVLQHKHGLLEASCTYLVLPRHIHHRARFITFNLPQPPRGNVVVAGTAIGPMEHKG